MIKRDLPDAYQTYKNSLHINCEECSALCCVALYFNKFDGFPENKEAGKPCIYLNGDFKCKIYTQLEDKHMKGCIAYDCFGAGQYTTQLWKSKGDWMTLPLQKNNIFLTFEKIRLLNQMMWYLLEVYTICDKTDLNTVDLLINQNREFVLLNIDGLIVKDIEESRKNVNELLKKVTHSLSEKSTFKLKHNLQMGKDFSNKNLNNSDLSMACLIASNLTSCSLINANFLGTDLRDVNVCDTDLCESLFLTQFQINSMIGNKQTKLPVGLTHPNHWANK